MTGVERPPYGAFHARFWPANDHFSGSPFSMETPSRLGPRQSGQSPTEPICWARASEAEQARRMARALRADVGCWMLDVGKIVSRATNHFTFSRRSDGGSRLAAFAA